MTGKSISKEVAGLICDYTECYSSYVQQLAWFVWLKCEKEAKEEDLIETTTANHLDICDPVLKLWLRRRVWKIFRK